MLIGKSLVLYTCNCLREQFTIFLKLPANVVKNSYILCQFATLLTVNIIKLKLNLFNKFFLMAAIDPAFAGHPAHDECVGRCCDGIAGLCLSFVTRYMYSCNLLNLT